jgi:hypothetical protein
VKELADIKLTVSTTKEPRQRSVIRAAVPIAYAHWEGFVKAASEGYLNYIQFQNLRFRELKSCLVVLGCKKHVHQLVASYKSALNTEAVEFIRSRMNEYASFVLGAAIDTDSNLSSVVFANIAHSIGIPTARYETKYKFIDVSLVDKRNKIAHGEVHNIAPDECRRLCDQVIQLMREFKVDISNSVTNRTYRR